MPTKRRCTAALARFGHNTFLFFFLAAVFAQLSLSVSSSSFLFFSRSFVHTVHLAMDWDLFDACAAGNVASVTAKLKSGASVNTAFYWVCSLLLLFLLFLLFFLFLFWFLKGKRGAVLRLFSTAVSTPLDLSRPLSTSLYLSRPLSSFPFLSTSFSTSFTYSRSLSPPLAGKDAAACCQRGWSAAGCAGAA